MDKRIIPASDEAWDERSLGLDEESVKVVDEEIEASIDESAGTQLISIRMQKSMIEDFKTIAALNGNIGYQTLMKQILQRFIDCEKKRIWSELIADKLKEQAKASNDVKKPKEKPRKAA